MAAEVLVALPGQPGSSTLDARVLEVSPRPAAAPEWLADFGLSTSAPSHLLRLALDDPSRLPLADGAGGLARVVLGKQSPAALLLAGGGRLTPAAVSIDVRRTTCGSVLPLPLGTERVFPEPRQGTDRTAGVTNP